MNSNCDIYIKQINKNEFLKRNCNAGNDGIVSGVIEYVFAPALNSFVLWVLDEAVKSGIKRLYFLARDAYFMYVTAAEYVKKYNLPIECRYLYCSRFSLRIPLFSVCQDEALDYITLGGLSVTPERILQRTGFSSRESEEFLNRNDFLSFKKNEEIPRNRLNDVKNFLSENMIYKEKAGNISQKALDMFDRFLVQEGFKDDVKMAVVDSGWVGSMQKVLNESLSRINAKQRLEGFYWGLYYIPDIVCKSKYHTFFFAPDSGIRKKTYFNNCLFEAVFTAPHGMTLGYETDDNSYKILPKLGSISACKADEIQKYEKIFADYAKRITENDYKLIKKELLSSKVKKIIESNLKRLMHHPSKDEADYFGKLDFSDDVVETDNEKTASYLTEKELRDNHFILRIINGAFRHHIVKQSAWYEGSAVMYGRNPYLHIFQYTIYRYFMYALKEYKYRRKNGKRSKR